MKPGEGDAYDKPLDIETHNGDVVITGPGAASVALTGKAAAASADRLAEAARLALSGDAKNVPEKDANGSANGADRS